MEASHERFPYRAQPERTSRALNAISSNVILQSRMCIWNLRITNPSKLAALILAPSVGSPIDASWNLPGFALDRDSF